MRRGPVHFSDEQLAWIKACADMPRVELHALFVQIYRRDDVTVDNIKSLCSRMGWTAGPDGRRRNAGKSFIFTADQVAWLHQNASLSRTEVATAFSAAFPDASITLAQIISWRKNHKVTTGRNGRFQKGQVPPNKGRKGFSPPGSEKGWFKKGNIPHTHRGVGHESIDRKDGYVWLIVGEINPHTGAATRRVMKHRWLWEKANGPVPKGYRLKCLDGNKLNTDPSNWEAIPAALAPRLNGRFGRGYDDAPAELKPTIMATAKLEHRLREIRKGASDA
jgi:hypothetical protein